MEPFKNIYSQAFFDQFTNVMAEVVTSFNTKQFLTEIFDASWDDRELKQRMRHTTEVLHKQLSRDYKKDIADLLRFMRVWDDKAVKVGQYDSLAFMFLADYVELYGLDDFETSMMATEVITPFTSCEFSIRPFIIKYPEKGMKQMLAWSKHENLHVRRLASEGCRPRLPWAMALPGLKKDPTLILPILENLKNDTSEYVRRSVANNLNDIAKDNPETVIETAKRWKGETKETDWVVKHACRTLLKQGNQELMGLFGFGSIKDINIKNFNLLTSRVRIGEALAFRFELENRSEVVTKIRLEYNIYYMKANGKLAPKVFKISEKDYETDSTTIIERKQSFKIITTRKFHLGEHQVALVINGNELDKYNFELIQ
ncbi:MAG: DNA alkylation repair protein [Flavobacterium sp. MedPE-SWcel]|uniref:DNA alkylation repair protein n=1 Tax=uncultured Flavobacterium sp. TaxID=165435 RepID=UPI00091014C2|nr:DNA alkylation repair protein [uncultured Flavobacterium sp.]OIQ21653.1 MAG: DNA alkylation repair protein [Flavobacterium sp. MedPE-SWcel]